MLEPDAGFTIKHDKKSISASPASSATPASSTNPTEASTPNGAAPLPRPTVAELKQAFAESQAATPPAPSPVPPLPTPPAPAPNIQTIQTSDPNFVVTKNLDAASVFSTAAPTASFTSPIEKQPKPAPVNAAPRPAIEISNPMAPRSLFEEPQPSTPSVAFNDPASAPDAPRPGTDPGAKKGFDKDDIKRLKEKLNTDQVKSFATYIKTNPMRALLIASSVIIVILIIAIALVA